MKKALITGIRGQDGAFLAYELIKRGYSVTGIDRRSGDATYWRLKEKGVYDDIKIYHADITEYHAVKKVIQEVKPDIVFNLAAQSFVKASFANPFTTFSVNAVGCMNILTAILELNMMKTRFYQASTSELFGNADMFPQNEDTPLKPRSPYGVAKLAAHWYTINMRESYELFACCGILFNHESEFRGEEFVTRKITKGLSEFFHGKRTQPIVLGNIDAKRDWGYAGDYVKAMIAMMNYRKAEEFVIATGETHSVREFAEIAFHSIGENLGWEIRKDKEIGITEKYGKVIITDKSMMREAEINILQGNAEKAYKKLHWKPTKKFETLVEDMVKKDIERTAKQFGVQIANKNYTSRLL